MADVDGAGWGETHATCPATDIFNNGCGGSIVSFGYLDGWRSGEQTSPVDEVRAFVAAQPNACSDAATDEFAPDA